MFLVDHSHTHHELLATHHWPLANEFHREELLLKVTFSQSPMSGYCGSLRYSVSDKSMLQEMDISDHAMGGNKHGKADCHISMIAETRSIKRKKKVSLSSQLCIQRQEKQAYIEPTIMM